MTDAEIIKANDILDKFDFFSQRAGRELWSDKPKDIQDKDIEIFSNNVKFLKDFITRLQADQEALIAGQETLQKALAEKNAEIEELKTVFDYDFSKFESEYDSKIKAEAIKEFASAYKDQIKNYTGMFTDEGFYVSHEAVLSAVDFVLNRMAGDTE